jgi:hypothetical protein
VEALALSELLLKAFEWPERNDNLQQCHLTRIRQRLYASLDDERSETALGEREKLVRVGGVRAAVARLAHVCGTEVFGPITGPELKPTGALNRQINRLYDALADA